MTAYSLTAVTPATVPWPSYTTLRDSTDQERPSNLIGLEDLDVVQRYAVR